MGHELTEKYLSDAWKEFVQPRFSAHTASSFTGSR